MVAFEILRNQPEQHAKSYIKGFVLSIRFVRFLRVQNKNRSGVCKYMTSFYERAAAITGENRIKTKAFWSIPHPCGEWTGKK